MTWREQAACYGLPSEWWYYDATENGWQENRDRGLKICQTCPVRLECLDEGLRREPLGTWGGQTERERDATRKSQGIRLESRVGPVRHGTPGGYRICDIDDGRACKVCRDAEARRISIYRGLTVPDDLPPHRCGNYAGYVTLARINKLTGSTWNCEACSRANRESKAKQRLSPVVRQRQNSYKKGKDTRYVPGRGRGYDEGWLY